MIIRELQGQPDLTGVGCMQELTGLGIQLVNDAVEVRPATRPPLSFVPGSRPSINRQGQIAFSARRAGSPAMIVLMTPQGS